MKHHFQWNQKQLHIWAYQITIVKSSHSVEPLFICKQRAFPKYVYTSKVKQDFANKHRHSSKKPVHTANYYFNMRTFEKYLPHKGHLRFLCGMVINFFEQILQTHSWSSSGECCKQASAMLTLQQIHFFRSNEYVSSWKLCLFGADVDWWNCWISAWWMLKFSLTKGHWGYQRECWRKGSSSAFQRCIPPPQRKHFTWSDEPE